MNKKRQAERRLGGTRQRWFIVIMMTAVALTFGILKILQNAPDTSEHSAREAMENPRISTGREASWKETDDPARDGWDTEVFADKTKKQLNAFGSMLAKPGEIDVSAVEHLIAPDFVCGPLQGNLVTVLDDPYLKIDRLSADSNAGEGSFDGADGLVEAMRALVEPFSKATDVRFEVKVFRVDAAQNTVSTRQYFSITGRTQSGMVEQHATWDIGWTPGSSQTVPLMQWIRAVDFEQTVSRQPTGALFADCTESVIGDTSAYAEQFLRGANHWLERIQDPSRFALFGNPGVTVGDVNGDGLDDLYVCQEAGLPNRLFIQNPDGSAREASASWGVDWLESSRSALLIDLDNDSDQDLVVAILGGVVVAENHGQERFLLRDVLSGSEDTMSLSAVDYDVDGRLDLYVCAYFENRTSSQNTTIGLPGASADFIVHDANNGGKNMLFQNQISPDGTWRFIDVTGQVGLDENNHRYSFAAAWDDFDNDGDLDLYVANDYGRDHFYRNDGPGASPQFSDISESARVENSAAGMAVTWGDYDRDGHMDVFVANMWSSAGKRIAYQNKFQPDAPEEIKQRFQRLARGNTLLRNQGDGTFHDDSTPAGIEMGRWAWGSHFVDLNNDGWEDLMVLNGYITTPDAGDL